jgi:hypothetical protein
MVQLQQQCRAATLESFDEDELPQGSISVEVGQAYPPCFGEELAPTSLAGQAHAAQVESEVEVRIDSQSR